MALAPTGLTVIIGANGEGKTNLLEAVGYLATLASFRGAPTEALVRVGAERRSCGPGLAWRAGAARSRGRSARGPRPGSRSTASRCAGPATCSAPCGSRVFSPDDLALVKGGPAERRALPRRPARRLPPASGTRCAPTSSGSCASGRPCSSRPAGGSPPRSALTLDVWDAKLADAGTTLAPRAGRAGGAARARVVDGLRAAGRPAGDRRRSPTSAPWRVGRSGGGAGGGPRATTCAAGSHGGPAPRRSR